MMRGRTNGVAVHQWQCISLTVSSLDARLRRMTVMATPLRFTKWITAAFLVSVALGFVVLIGNALIR